VIAETKMLNCLRCTRPVQVAASVSRVHCPRCRKEARAEYDRKKHRRYYLAHRDAVLRRTTAYRATLTPEQKRRYSARAVRHYHAQQAALNRSKLHGRELKHLGWDLSIIPASQLRDPLILRSQGRRQRELDKLADAILQGSVVSPGAGR